MNFRSQLVPVQASASHQNFFSLQVRDRNIRVRARNIILSPSSRQRWTMQWGGHLWWAFWLLRWFRWGRWWHWLHPNFVMFVVMNFRTNRVIVGDSDWFRLGVEKVEKCSRLSCFLLFPVRSTGLGLGRFFSSWSFPFLVWEHGYKTTCCGCEDKSAHLPDSHGLMNNCTITQKEKFLRKSCARKTHLPMQPIRSSQLPITDQKFSPRKSIESQTSFLFFSFFHFRYAYRMVSSTSGPAVPDGSSSSGTRTLNPVFSRIIKYIESSELGVVYLSMAADLRFLTKSWEI